MDNLVSNNNGQALTNSLLIAQKFGKYHKDVLEVIREIRKAENSAVLQMFTESNYYSEQNKMMPMFTMTRDGFSLLVMGFSGSKALDFKLEFIDAFNKMEHELSKPKELSRKDLAMMIVDAEVELEKERAEKQILISENASQAKELEEAAPKVVFADAVTSADNDILIRDLAKLIAQNGVDIGQNRLYLWLVKKNYLEVRTRWSATNKKNENSYWPTQKSANLGIFKLVPMVIHSPGKKSFEKFTTKCTGKGQTYFIGRYLKELQEEAERV